eukprot:m.117579 g.117579  ORF g.117579 m.117579 type:complete len:740 (+) comp13201_c0_seq1:65-2284(+)
MSKTVPTYEQDTERCKKFLEEFVRTDGGASQDEDTSYKTQLLDVANRKSTSVTIHLDDVQEYDHDLADAIAGNTKRYLEMFSAAIDQIGVQPTDEVADMSPLDVFVSHRRLLMETSQSAQGREENRMEQHRTRYPPSLLRRYSVLFQPPSQDKRMSIRQVEACHIGKLVQLEGIVIRSTPVKPQITVATYACERCNSEIYQTITSPTFMPMTVCNSDICVTNKWNGRLQMMCRGSRFQKFQELKIQEMAKDVPTGHVPRTMTVHAYGDVTRCASPGDQIIISGIFLPKPHQGFKAIRAGLLSDTYLEAQSIEQVKKTHTNTSLDEDTREELMDISREISDHSTYDRLAASIAPAIHGLVDVKKALLLLLVGGTDRHMADGMKIRGCVNVCLVGDPGVAKSQLLKEVTVLAPRGVYTTGRGSSGVGLTAAVTKDQYTGELMLEGGALVLADMGVCCIDEFDKMDESDRTSIHEVMEQQTVSIAKAGITTSLNARASILAAANPLYGRYNPNKTTQQNVNLPTALLSRFDLLFLLLDRPDMDNDTRLAHHICYVHTHNDYPPTAESTPFDKEVLRNYITMAKERVPTIPRDLTDTIVGAYLAKRKEMTENPNIQYTGARTLLAILRLATALCKLRIHETADAKVTRDDVEEAIRLMEVSQASIEESKGGVRDLEDPTDEIYRIINGLQAGGNGQVEVKLARTQATYSGFTPEQFDDCINHYEDLGVWFVNEAKTKIVFVEA